MFSFKSTGPWTENLLQTWLDRSSGSNISFDVEARIIREDEEHPSPNTNAKVLDALSKLFAIQDRWEDVSLRISQLAAETVSEIDFMKVQPTSSIRSLTILLYNLSIEVSLENATSLRSLTLENFRLLSKTPILPNLTSLTLRNPLEHGTGVGIDSTRFFVDFLRLLPNIEYLRIEEGGEGGRDDLPSEIAAVPALRLPKLQCLDLWESNSAFVLLGVLEAPEVWSLSCSGLRRNGDPVDVLPALWGFIDRSNPPLSYLDISHCAMDEDEDEDKGEGLLRRILIKVQSLRHLSLRELGLTIKTMKSLSERRRNDANRQFLLCPNLVGLNLRSNKDIRDLSSSSESISMAIASMINERWRDGRLKTIVDIHESVLPLIRCAIEGGLRIIE